MKSKIVSPSLLSSYLYCKRKVYLERVLKLAEPDKEAMVRGSIRHEAYDSANKIDKEIVCSIKLGFSYEEIYKLYLKIYSAKLRESINKFKYRLKSVKIPLDEAYKSIIPFFEKQSSIRAEFLKGFIVKNDLYELELWENLVPKIKSEFRIKSKKHGIRGIIDQIEVYPRGLVPIELKTGSAPKEGVWPGHRMQLGCYALMMEDYFNINIKEGFVVYLDIQERRHIEINPFIRDEVISVRDEVIGMLESSELPEQCTTEKKCDVCGLRSKCFDTEFLEKLIKDKFRN
jgi:CRISPR-associated exonuclease Cas4